MIKSTVTPYVNRKSGQKYPYPVYISVFRAKKRFFVSTGLTCKTDIEGREFCANEPMKRTKDKKLNQMLNDAEEQCINAPNDMSNAQLKDLIAEVVQGKVPESKKPKDFLYYFDEFVGTKTRIGTIRTYNGTRRKIIAFDEHVKLDGIDKKWLLEFQNENMKDGKMCLNGISIHLRNIRAVYNYCIDQGYTEYYPFLRFKIKQDPDTRKRALTVEDMRKMVSLDLAGSWQEPYRDIFLLMFYLMGINASDLFALPHNAVQNGRIKYKRNKTGKLFDIAVPDEAMEIIRKWRGKDYLIFPYDRYKEHYDFLHHMNDALKTLGVRYNGTVPVDKKKGRGGPADEDMRLWPELSTYWSRHTFATIASELDISTDVIGRCLGHKGTTVTDIYIKFSQKKIDDAQRKVIDYVLEKTENADI